MANACNKPQSLCWFCKKSTHSGCNWSKYFKPVKGWNAKQTSVIQYSGRTSTRAIPSYMVYDCPEFVEG